VNDSANGNRSHTYDDFNRLAALRKPRLRLTRMSGMQRVVDVAQKDFF
jgi:hypothetical protein